LPILDVLGEVAEHPLARLGVAVEDARARLPRHLEHGRRENGDHGGIAWRIREERELAEQLAARMERDQRLVTVVVEEHHLDEAGEDDVRVLRWIATVVDDLVRLEIAHAHLTGELLAI